MKQEKYLNWGNAQLTPVEFPDCSMVSINRYMVSLSQMSEKKHTQKKYSCFSFFSLSNMNSKWLSLSVYMGVYSTPQYTMVSTLAKELAFRLLTVVLLYFNMNPTMYINSTDHENARKAAGWAGMLFATFSSLDAALRPKFKELRLFDELAIACVYVSLWAMFYSMFKHLSIYFMVMAGAFTWIIMGYACSQRGKSKDPIPHESLVQMLKHLKEESSGDREVQRSIDFLALVLVAVNPEDQNTLAVLKMVKEAHTPHPEATENTTENT